MAILFRDTGTTGRQKVPMDEEISIDGKVYVYALAHATLTASTSYRIGQDEFGFLTASHGAGNVSRVFRIGINTSGAVTTGNRAKLLVKGFFSSMVCPASQTISAGHAINLTAGVITDAAADYGDLVTQFATCVTTTASIGTVSVQMAGKYITASSV